MLKVFIANGPQQGRSFLLTENAVSVGRSSLNKIQLDEASVSRRHAKILRAEDRYYIEDLKSRNGTWVNGRVIESGKRVQVKEGVPVAIGNVVISLGSKCPPKRLPNQYSIDVLPRDADMPRDSLLRERRSKQRDDLRLLYSVSMALLESMELKEICEKALEAILLCLKRIDSAHMILCKTGSEKLIQIATRTRDSAKTEKLNYSRTLVRQALKEAKAIMMPDTSREAKENLSDSMENIGVKSVIAVPLISKTETKGVLYLQSVNVPHGFRQDDLFLLTSLSAPIALAIEKAALYSRSRQAEIKLEKSRDELETEVKRRTSELVKAKKKLEELATTDGLSGLYNYRYFIQCLELEYKRAIRYQHRLSLLMIDIDYFKDFNDTFGHLCGDFVIKSVSQLLKANVRGTDVVARYGGDEAAVILIETNQEEALDVARKLKREIDEYPFKWQGQPLDVKVSIGLATSPAVGVQDSYDLLNAADRALYQAKRSGRNSVIAYQPGKKKRPEPQEGLPQESRP
jgi:diguanylate cyclase (GGDEF)-like protein